MLVNIRGSNNNKQIYLFYNFINYLGNMISYEGKLDIGNKLNKFFKITGILNNVFRTQKSPKKQESNYTIRWPFRSCYMAAKLGLLKQGTAEE